MTFTAVCVMSLIYLHNDYLFMKLYLQEQVHSVDGRQVTKDQTEKLQKLNTK